jgi:hypothetical protein
VRLSLFGVGVRRLVKPLQPWTRRSRGS